MKKIIILLALTVFLSCACLADDFDGYIVKIKENTAQNMTSTAMLSDDVFLFSDMDDSDVVELLADDIDTVSKINSEHMLLKADDEASLEALIEMGIVESYEENGYLELFGYNVEANADYSSQKWYLDYINASFAWDAGVFGNDIKIALVDSGVYAHADIKNRIIPGKNYVTEDGLAETYTTDNTPHGTHVAGIIASACNELATVGISFNAKIIPLKVTDNTMFNMDKAITAIYDAVDYYDCDVINLSFGSTTYSTNLYNAIQHAVNKGVIVVAAAGNKGDTGYMYPASFDGMISVANAEKYNNSLRIYSSSQVNDKVDIAAPGTGITAISNSAGDVATVRGTSFSCPMVSAAAALAKAVDPDITQAEFERILKDTADSSYIASSGQGTDRWGSGLLDIEALLKEVMGDKDVFVSDVYTINGENFVSITNLTGSAIKECSVIINEYGSDGYLSKTKNTTLSISASESKELNLSEYGFGEASFVRVITDHVPGDVDGNGEVNLRDASAILRYKAGYEVSVIEATLDVNGDGDVNIRDASAILRYSAGFNVELH